MYRRAAPTGLTVGTSQTHYYTKPSRS